MKHNAIKFNCNVNGKHREVNIKDQTVIEALWSILKNKGTSILADSLRFAIEDICLVDNDDPVLCKTNKFVMLNYTLTVEQFVALKKSLLSYLPCKTYTKATQYGYICSI
jgi:hypothetical protein